MRLAISNNKKSCLALHIILRDNVQRVITDTRGWAIARLDDVG